MIICQKQDLFFPPKKTPNRIKLFNFRGKLLLIIFNTNGKILKK